MEDVKAIQTKQNSNIYDEAASMLMKRRNNPEEVVEALVENGLIREKASFVVETLSRQLAEAKRKKANHDIVIGLMWCSGGTVLILAQVGIIFWGAIVFGAIQLIKGVINSF